MNDLKILNIDGIECYEKDGTAYLKLETVARGLGFTDSRNGIDYVRWARVEKYLEEIGFATSGENIDYIPENIFYRLAMKAKNEAVEKFQAKIADEVIPSIRKTGGYVGNDDLFINTYMPNAEPAVRDMFRTQLMHIRQLNAKIEKDKPKVLFADSVASSKTSILVGELAKLLKQNGVNTGQKRLFAWMRDNGYLIKRKGGDYNMPTQRAMESGLFEIKETAISHADGHTSISKTPKVTGKGQSVFVNIFFGERNCSLKS